MEFGLWLDRKRQKWIEAWPATYAHLIAEALIEPPMDFCRANTDGEGEALVMKMNLTRSD